MGSKYCQREGRAFENNNRGYPTRYANKRSMYEVHGPRANGCDRLYAGSGCNRVLEPIQPKSVQWIDFYYARENGMAFLPGDVVSRRKGVFMHHGIMLGEGKVLHNTPIQGQHVSSLAEFSKGKRVRPRNLSSEHRRKVLAHVQTGNEAQDQSYSLFSNNCEHLVTRSTGGRARSPQLGGWVAGAGVAAAVLALTRHPGWALTGFYAGKTIYQNFTKAIDED